MTDKKQWGLIGLGWLGQSLAAFLDQRDISNWGTTTAGFNWLADAFPARPCDLLFLNTPPLPDITPQNYVDKIPSRPGQRIIFISSISVYGGQNGMVRESTPVSPKTASATWLVAVEDLLQKKFPANLTIVRAGGLIGGDRHPIFSLSKSGRAVAGESAINLIHRDDLVRIIYTLFLQNEIPAIVNAVCPYHPSKKEYYNFWSSKLELHTLQYLKASADHRIVSSEVLPQIYPNWIHPKLDQL